MTLESSSTKQVRKDNNREVNPIKSQFLIKDQLGQKHKAIPKSKLNMHPKDRDNNRWCNLHNLKEMILTVEEFSQKDKLLRHRMVRMLRNNTNSKFNSNSKIKRDMSYNCKNFNNSNRQ